MSDHSSFFQVLLNLDSLDHFWENWLHKPMWAHGSLDRLPHFFQSNYFTSISDLMKHYEGRLIINRRSSKFTFQTEVKKGEGTPLMDLNFAVQLVDVKKCIPGVEEASRELSQIFGFSEEKINVAIFASMCAEKEGLSFHYDGTDNMIIQTHGEKEIDLAANEYVQFPSGYQYSPGTRHLSQHVPQFVENGIPEQVPKKIETIKLQPGSVVTFPRGTWHQTRASEDSISVNFLIEAPTQLEMFVRYLNTVLLQNHNWRKPVYGYMEKSNRANIEKEMQKCLNQLPEIFKNIGSQEVLEQAFKDQIPVIPFRNHTRLLRASFFQFSYKNLPDGWVEVRISSLRGASTVDQDVKPNCFRVPAKTAQVIQWVEKRSGAFDLEVLSQAFPEIDENSLQALLELFIKQEILERVAFRPYPQ